MPATAHDESLLPTLVRKLSGDLQTGKTIRRLYATDASEYQEMPLAVAFPANESDIRELIRFANEHLIT